MTPATTSNAPNQRRIRAMGIGLVLLNLLLAYLLLRLWPAGLSKDSLGNTMQTINLWRGTSSFFSFDISLDVRLLLLVMVAGGLGSLIHAATSFGDYVGNENFDESWSWWYVLRPFIGMVMAVIFYMAIRGGFLSTGTEAGSINPFGIAALAGLVGMFSKQAGDKLDEIFNTLFKTDGDKKRKDGLTNPVPIVSDIEPKSVEPLTENVKVEVIGTDFAQGAVVRVNGTNRETIFVGETKLTSQLLPTDVEKEGELEIVVYNPPPGGGASTPIRLKIGPQAQNGTTNPVPNVSDTEPESVETVTEPDKLNVEKEENE